MNGGNMGRTEKELDDYHFKFKISIVGDSQVGKSTFLDAISSTLGSVVENEQSSELHIKVTYLKYITLSYIDYLLHR
jgi:GTPase SAR1 family protein